MESSNTFPQEIPAALAREIYLESTKDADAIKTILALPNTPTDVLVEIGERIPFLNLEELAPLLVSHPNFTEELLDRIVDSLKIQWWGDDPIECRLGWETLERERDAYLQKLQ